MPLEMSILTASDIGGFDPHIDANAYTHVKNIKHLTVLAAVDEMTAENGGLEVVDGSHRMAIPLGDDRCIDRAWVDGQAWTPCDLETGTFLSLTYTVLASNLTTCRRHSDLRVVPRAPERRQHQQQGPARGVCDVQPGGGGQPARPVLRGSAAAVAGDAPAQGGRGVRGGADAVWVRVSDADRVEWDCAAWREKDVLWMYRSRSDIDESS
jgi:hypothetical protein